MPHLPTAVLSLVIFALGFGLRAQGSQQTPEVLVTAQVIYSRLSPADDGIEILFSYVYSTGHPEKLPKTYVCAWGDLTYLVNTPDGKQHSLHVIDKKENTGDSTLEFFNFVASKIFDAVGVRPSYFDDKEEQRRYYWRQTEVPLFTVPGEYCLIETGTFHDTANVLPDLPFRSTAATWVVDPKLVSVKNLKLKSQKIVKRRIGAQIPPVDWAVWETPSGNRVAHGLVGKSVFPEDRVPSEKRKMRAEGWMYIGMAYDFTFMSNGQFLSEEIKPIYGIE